jgi:hypothetical protein
MVSRSIRISTPRNPAATMTCCNWSASPKLNADRICAACSLPILRSTASAIAACQGQTSIGQYAMHLGNRCGFVRNELQAMLANDTVESRISKRHVCSTAHTPFDRGGCFTRSACSREHARVEIEADNLSCRTDLICYENGMVRPCSSPASDRAKLARGHRRQRSTPCPRNSTAKSP